MKFKNPACTVDLIANYGGDGIILIKRNTEPFKGRWALPGGFVEYGKETLGFAARREFKEETGITLKPSQIAPFGFYGDPKRDPRGHCVTHVFYSFLLEEDIAGMLNKLNFGSVEVMSVNLFNWNKLPQMAFDHKKIIEDFKESING